MNKTYVKENGVTRLSDEDIKKEERKAVLINKMNIYDFTDEKGVVLTDRSLRTLTSYLDYLNRSGFKQAYDALTVLVYRVITVKCEEDLTDSENSLYNVTNEMLNKKYITVKPSGFYDRINKKYEMVFANELPVMLTVAKEVIKRYIKASLENFTEKQLSNIDEQISNGADPLDFITVNDVKFSDIGDTTLKAFAISQLKYYLSDKIKKDEGYKHLCGDCSCEIKNCQKLQDIRKKNISEYEFITDGIQRTHDEENINRDDPDYDEDNLEITDEFIVTKCKKFFKKERTTSKSKIQRVYIVKK